MVNEIKNIASNNVDYLLKVIINNIHDDILPILVNRNEDPHLQFYLIYHLPRMRAFQYLVSGSDTGYTFPQSYSSYLYKSYQQHLKSGILSGSELAEIIEFALNSFEVIKLLELSELKNSSEFNSLTKYEKLKKILSLFNEAKSSELENISNNDSIVFNIILKIGLLSLPQLPTNPKYAFFSGGPNKGKLIPGAEKQKRIIDNLDDFVKSKQYPELKLPFSDRLFLLITLMEGTLWKKNTDNTIKDFFVGNIYDLLNSPTLKAFKVNSLYLKPFDYYLYGNFKVKKDRTGLEKEKEIRRILKEYFLKEQILYFVQFSKFFLAENNYNNAQHFIELGSPFIPKSIVHGITSIILPEKIGIFSEENDQLKKEQCYCFNFNLYKNLQIDGLEIINNPWALYRENDEDFSPSLNNFNRKDSVALYEDERQILIRVKNSLNQSKVIIVQLFSDGNDEVLKSLGIHVVKNFEDYKYTLKAFVEKLFFINRSVTLNTDTNNWFSKAFCKYYCEFDKVRLSKDNHDNYRKWETTYFSLLINNRDITIYDVGVGYGRLEAKLKNDPTINTEKIKFVGIDLSKTLLQNASDKGLIHEKYHCDFRSIDLFEKEIADIVCFIYTTFGYFKESAENTEVLKKAYDLLKPNGTLIIEQFNPYKTPDHCSIGPESFKTNIEEREYRLVKTSNFKQPGEIEDENNKPINEDYALYYGNYVYFDCSGCTEEMIKCDTYEIRLYTEKWFSDVFSNTNFRYYGLDGNVHNGNKQEAPIMIVEIKKEITKEILEELNEIVYNKIDIKIDRENLYSEPTKELMKSSDKIKKTSKNKRESIFEMLYKINIELDNEEDINEIIKRYNSIVE